MGRCSKVQAIMLVSLVAATGCLTAQPALATPLPPPPTPTTAALLHPQAINYPRPELSVDAEALANAGCFPHKTSYYSGWRCESDVLAALGCDYGESDDLLAGLTPAYPVLRCIREGWDSPGPHFRPVGCMVRHYESSVLLRDGVFALVAPIPDLQAVFAPIESANEALSYALVATGLHARYGLKGGESISVMYYLVDTVQDTHVDETEDGYLVHLYSDYQPECGCGKHTRYTVDVSVTRDGQVRQARTPFFVFQGCLD